MAPDVVVVGAGLAGLSVAAHLAPHRRVLVLDAADQPGSEATSHNAGMVRRLGEDPWERCLAVRTAAWMADPPDDWRDLVVSTRTGAVLALASDKHQLTDAVAHLRAVGVDVQALDRPAQVAPALAGAPLVAAWYLPGERVADPHALVTGFLRQIRRGGGEIRCRTEVSDLIVRSGQVVGVHTQHGALYANHVVMAAGAWSGGLAAKAGLRRPLTPLRRSLFVTRPHPVSYPHHPWVWVDDAGIYARPEAGGWLCSGCDESQDAAVFGSRGPLEPEFAALGLDKLERHLPALRDAEPVSGWTGLRTFAPDRRPILGPDHEMGGLWWAAGLGGFGVTCSVAIGEAVAAWMVGDETPWLDRRGVGTARPMLQRWPIRPHGDLHRLKLIDVD